jgi:hypothetical protein
MFISELFEGKGDVPSNPKQKQGPAGQFKGTDKAPARNKLVGEASAHAKEVAKKRAEYERTQDKKRDARGETYNVGNAKAVKPPKPVAEGPEEHYAKDPSGYKRNMHTGRLEGPHWSAVGDKPTGRYAKRLERYAKERAEREAKPKTEAMEREPQYADADFSKPMFEFGDSTGLKPGALANHGLLGNVKILSVKGHHAEVCSVRGGKHYHVELSSLRTGHLDEDTNPQDEITVDVPLLIRLLEYAKEDAKTDMDLHNVAERLIKLSGQGCLSMDQYDAIVGGVKEMAPGREAYAGRGNVPGMTT